MLPALHTYGHIDVMVYTLNGIAMILNHEWVNNILKLILVIGVGAEGFRFATAGMQQTTLGGLMIRKFITGAIIFGIIILPKKDVTIVDHVTKETEVVSGMPYGFVPVVLTEMIGAGITSLAEQAFAVPGSMNFTNYGMTFGASLVQEFQNIRMQNPELSMNFDNFTRRCVIPAAARGGALTPPQLFEAGDVWSKLKAVYPNDG